MKPKELSLSEKKAITAWQKCMREIRKNEKTQETPEKGRSRRRRQS